MRVLEAFRRSTLPLAAGLATGAYLLFGAPQDQVGLASALAPVAAATAAFTPDGAAYLLPVALNGLAYLAVARAIRSTWATSRSLSIALMALLGLWVGASLAGDLYAHQLRPYTEVVLNPGMRLTATTPNGTLAILAGRGTRRTYQGEGWQKSLLLEARTRRWDGSLGLYDPAESYSPHGRLLVEEGRQHFPTESEAEAWLRGRSLEAGVGKEKLIYTNDGLVLRYSMDPVPGSGAPTAQVDLWQIYVGGLRPHGLPGADDGAVRIEGGAVAEASTPHPL